MRIVTIIGAAIALLLPTCANAAAFTFNLSGVVSSLEGSESALKLGDKFSASIDVLRTTGDVNFENKSAGWYYIVEAAGFESVGPTSGTLYTGNTPLAGISSFDIYTYGKINSAFRFVRPSSEIFFQSTGNVNEALYLNASGGGGQIKSDNLDGVTFSSTGFQSDLTQYLNGDGGNNLIVTYSDVKWSISPIGAALPEPATWMMMILGFGAVGYAVRRKTVLRYI